MRRAASKNKYPVKSLVKALRILDVLAERPAGFGITELSEALHIGKSTVHRLLATLKEEGYVVTHPEGSRYILGGQNCPVRTTAFRPVPAADFWRACYPPVGPGSQRDG
jgi:DNA-binding IclR family transcriptional regulator